MVVAQPPQPPHQPPPRGLTAAHAAARTAARAPAITGVAAACVSAARAAQPQPQPAPLPAAATARARRHPRIPLERRHCNGAGLREYHAQRSPPPRGASPNSTQPGSSTRNAAATARTAATAVAGLPRLRRGRLDRARFHRVRRQHGWPQRAAPARARRQRNVPVRVATAMAQRQHARSTPAAVAMARRQRELRPGCTHRRRQRAQRVFAAGHPEDGLALETAMQTCSSTATFPPAEAGDGMDNFDVGKSYKAPVYSGAGDYLVEDTE